MLSIFFVLFIIIAGINISNFVAMENKAKDAVMNVMDSEFPYEGSTPIRIMIDNPYFAVAFNNSNGSVEYSNYRRMNGLTDSECESLARSIYNSNTGDIYYGKKGSYRYQIERQDDMSFFVLVDINAQIEQQGQFLLNSSLISLLGYSGIFVLIMVGSRLVYKTSEDSYRKQRNKRGI